MAKSLVRHTLGPNKASGNNTQNYMCQMQKILGRFMRMPSSEATLLSHAPVSYTHLTLPTTPYV